MDIGEVLFLIQFLVFIAITLYKLYNILSNFETYDIKTGFMLFVLTWLCFGVGMVINITAVGYAIDSAGTINLVFSQLFTLESWLVILNTLFMLIELFLFLSKLGIDQTRQAHNSRAEYKTH